MLSELFLRRFRCIMLSRLFNFIRFKHTTPSVLFRNRLYLERDSQARRILSNLGLTFRNSKWSNYTLTNISSSFRLAFFGTFKASLFTCFMVSSFWYFTDLYLGVNIFNEGYCYFWFIRDSIYHCVLFFVWFSYMFINKLCSLFYSHLFNTVYSVPETDEPKADVQKPTPTLTKADQHLVFFNWLRKHKFDTKHTDNIERLFSNSHIYQGWRKVYSFFPTLYRTVDLVKVSEMAHIGTGMCKSVQVMSEESSISVDQTHTVDGCKGFATAEEMTLAHSKAARAKPTKFTQSVDNHPSFNLSRTAYDWNLANITNEASQYYAMVTAPTGQYYMTPNDTKELTTLTIQNPELELLKTNLDNQVKLYQQQRWLYRYSLMHRKVLKSSNALTNSKRLLTSGFFDQSLTSQNLWASSLLSSRVQNASPISPNADFIKNTLKNSYGNLVLPSSNNPFYNQNSQLADGSSQYNSLAQLETSYMWDLKRFFLFNTSVSNSSTLHPALATYSREALLTSLLRQQNRLAELAFVKTALLRSYAMNQPSFQTTTLRHPEASSELQTLLGKSLNLEFNEVDLFNHDTMSLLEDVALFPTNSTDKRLVFYSSFYAYHSNKLNPLNDLTVELLHTTVAKPSTVVNVMPKYDTYFLTSLVNFIYATK